MSHFKQEATSDMTYATQIFLVEQIKFHRAIADQLEAVYLKCWGGDGASGGVAGVETATEVQEVPQYSAATRGGGLNAWGDDENLYEEIMN